MKSFVKSEKAPNPVGPYSQAVLTEGKFLFISMQIPLNTDGVIADGGISGQTEQILKNIVAILDEAGCSIQNVVKTTVFLKKIEDFAEMNKVYDKFFGESKPARSTIEVSQIPKDALIGIDAIAAI